MPTCPRCGQSLPDDNSPKCPVCGAVLDKPRADWQLVILYALLTVGGIITARLFGMHYPAYLLIFGGIMALIVLVHETQDIVKMIGFFLGTVLAASWGASIILTGIGLRMSIDWITFILLLLTGISLIYRPFKQVKWTDSMYQGASSIVLRLVTWILVLRPVMFVLGAMCVLQGILLVSYGQSLLDVLMPTNAA